jgi:hypothetical protein
MLSAMYQGGVVNRGIVIKGVTLGVQRKTENVKVFNVAREKASGGGKAGSRQATMSETAFLDETNEPTSLSPKC